MSAPNGLKRPDTEPAEDGLTLRVTPVLAVEFYPSNLATPKQASDAAISNPDQTLQNIVVASESETTLSGQPAFGLPLPHTLPDRRGALRGIAARIP